MNLRILITLVDSFLFSSLTNGQQKLLDNQMLSLTNKQWADDIHILYDSLQKQHANLFHFTPKKKFNYKFNNILKQLPVLNNYQKILNIRQFVALAGDGHTFINNPKSFHSFPIVFFEFPDGIRVVKTDKKYSHLLGKKLIAINKTNISTVIDSLNTIVSRDESDTYILNERMNHISTPEYLYAFKIIPTIHSASFVFEDNNHKIVSNIDALPNDSIITWVDAYRPLPLFMENSNTPKQETLWWKEISQNTFYLSFQTYPDWKEMNELCDLMLNYLTHRKNIKKIIIDMRSNGGGNFDKGLKVLLPSFLNLNAIHPGIKYYIIIGRKTFSAGMSNATHLRDCLKATTVG